MQKIIQKKIILELIWLIFTAIAILIILLPIYTHTEGYPFYFVNSLYIFLFITLFRYITFIRFTFIAKLQKVKFVLFFAFIPLTFYLIGQLNSFREYLESMGNVDIMTGLDFDTIEWLSPYIQNQMYFVSIGSIMLCIIFPFALLRSIWRQHNNK